MYKACALYSLCCFEFSTIDKSNRPVHFMNDLFPPFSLHFLYFIARGKCRRLSLCVCVDDNSGSLKPRGRFSFFL